MEIKLTVKNIKQLITAKQIKQDDAEEYIRWQDDAKIVRLPISIITPKGIDIIEKELGKTKQTSELLGTLKKIATYRRIQKDPDNVVVKKLNLLPTAIKAYLQKNTKHHWLFQMDENGIAIPYFVNNIEYHEYDTRNQQPAYVSISLKYWDQGIQSSSIHFHSEDLNGNSIKDLLFKREYYLENEDFLTDHTNQLDRYFLYSKQIGNQFSGLNGTGSVESRYSYGNTALVKNGIASKLVIDEGEDDSNSRRSGRARYVVGNSYWNATKNADEDESENSNVVAAPIHPYLFTFHLQNHEHLWVHVDLVEPYKWDKNIYEKLILPEKVKNLITILTQGSKHLMDDIVAGKTGGIIVLATGGPGVGKTLTAEVYSEVIERPLYVVQSSQLGTEPEDLEKELKAVLERAARWNAILLIDEADVYIQERGSNLKQNAMVGVFLRVLEYYRGVLFMTSNRATIIDDAIVSRATAHIRYEMPDKDALKKIWNVLMTQFKIDTKSKEQKDLIDSLIKTFPHISGRDVKNMLKLAALLAKENKEPLTLQTFEFVTEFLNVNKGK